MKTDSGSSASSFPFEFTPGMFEGGYVLAATCLFGLERFLGAEIDALGYERLFTLDGRVFFRGGDDAVAGANINLRTAERVFIVAGPPFRADSFDALFEGTRAIAWENFIPRDSSFPVSGHSVKSGLASVPDCQKIVKKAIAVRLGKKYGLEKLPESTPGLSVEFFILKDQAFLMLDTSGTALHKRGYRPEAGAAPLRETLAAAIVMNARTAEHPDIFLWDPFCGSGTIPIEAAMLAAGIAPGLRRSFAAEGAPFLDAGAWRDARSAALEKMSAAASCPFRAMGSDIDPSCIRTARMNAGRAGVGSMIRFETADARKIRKPDDPSLRGTLICNPPYGERMMSAADAEKLYRDIGRNFRAFDRWQIYVLTSCETFEALFGRRADKKRKLYNGMIPCILYQYIKPHDGGRSSVARHSGCTRSGSKDED